MLDRLFIRLQYSARNVEKLGVIRLLTSLVRVADMFVTLYRLFICAEYVYSILHPRHRYANPNLSICLSNYSVLLRKSDSIASFCEVKRTQSPNFSRLVSAPFPSGRAVAENATSLMGLAPFPPAPTSCNTSGHQQHLLGRFSSRTPRPMKYREAGYATPAVHVLVPHVIERF